MLEFRFQTKGNAFESFIFNYWRERTEGGISSGPVVLLRHEFFCIVFTSGTDFLPGALVLRHLSLQTLKIHSWTQFQTWYIYRILGNLCEIPIKISSSLRWQDGQTFFGIINFMFVKFVKIWCLIIADDTIRKAAINLPTWIFSKFHINVILLPGNWFNMEGKH